MDIIDIMLARAMTPQGQTDIYVNKANQAAAKAEQAKADASEAVATVEAAAETIANTQEAAAALLEDAQEALATAQAAQTDTLSTEDVDAEVKKLRLTRSQVTGNSNEYYENLHVHYPDNTESVIPNTVSLKKSTGTSEISGMTQKAITDALTDKADITYINNKINISAADAGKYVMINNNGTLVAGSANITPTNPDVEPAVEPTTYGFSTDIIGLDINYEENNCTRTQSAVNLTMGQDFNQFVMYGGRTKCNVDDNGTINAFYGDQDYVEDGSNGQVMIYQPKFYYKRVIYKTVELSKGAAIYHEELSLSPIARNGFKLAPIFNDDLDYILISAYNGSLSNNKLSSVSGAIPMTGSQIQQGEGYAVNREQGWHIMNMAALSMEQMLQIVEFGHLNGQNAIENGITYSPFISQKPFLFITGSTAYLGNNTGHAISSTAINNNKSYTYTEANQRAISYRGMENPWGNLWNMIGGINIIGNGSSGGGSISICTDYNYTPNTNGANYEDIGFNLPNNRNWIRAFGYGGEKYDWVFLPAECSDQANSLIPIGDNIWIKSNYSGANMLVQGGAIGYKEECGPFYYSSTISYSSDAIKNYSARLMYIPTKNSIYTSNIAKWKAYIGG